MAKIAVSLHGVILKEMMLSKERITIGRRPHNDLVIDNSAISAEHAVIVTILRDAFLEDLNSTNGTRVNGQPINKHFLKNNDVIELAKYKIRFIDEQQSKNTESRHRRVPNGISQDFSNTVKVRSNNNHQDGNTVVLAGSALSACGIIKIVTGPNAGKEITLTKQLTTIGLAGQQVAVVTRRGHVYSLTHIEGGTYPLVNGKSIGASAYVMAPGDVIDLSGTNMEFVHK